MVLVLGNVSFAASGPSIVVEQPPQPSGGASNLNTVSNWFSLLAQIISWVSYVFWALTVLFIIIAAFSYLTAGGDEEKVKTSHKRVRYAVYAIIVALLATVLPTLIQSFLRGQ